MVTPMGGWVWYPALKKPFLQLLKINTTNSCRYSCRKSLESVPTGLLITIMLCKQRNERFLDQEQCPEDLLTELPYDSKQLCHWLCHFVAETQQKNGTKYPATTLYQLLCGVNRFMRSVDARAPNMIDQKNPDIKKLHCIMDSVFHSLQVERVRGKACFSCHKGRRNLCMGTRCFESQHTSKFTLRSFLFKRKSVFLTRG